MSSCAWALAERGLSGIGGVRECLSGVRVALAKDDRKLAETLSDAYGDFKIDGLDESSGKYRLEFTDPRFSAKSLDFTLGASTYLGTIELT